MKKINVSKNFRVPVLVVCEGQLETYYFQQLDTIRQDTRRGADDLHFTIICAGGGGPMKSVAVAKQEQASGRYREIWCVVDVESPDSRELSKAIRVASKRRFELALTNPSFDAWLLAHLRPWCVGDGSTARELKDALTREMGRRFTREGGKEFVTNILGDRCCGLNAARDGNIRTLDDVAQVCGQTRATRVHRLVERFMPRSLSE